MIASADFDRYEWTRRLRAAPRWWRDSLMSCLPVTLRSRFGAARGRLVAEPGDDELVVVRETAAGNRELGRYPLVDLAATPVTDERRAGKGAAVVLRLPETAVLRREMELPLAVEAELASMLRLGMDRYTPFPADQVYFDYRVVERNRNTGRLRLRLAMVQRAVADRWLKVMERQGLRPLAIDVAPDGGGFDLLPDERRPRRSRAGRNLNLTLTLVVAVLLAAALAIPLHQHRGAAVEALRQAAEARREAEQTAELRNELERVLASTQVLVAKKHRARPLIEVLDALTRLLPDDTWVQQLEIQDGKAEIRGESKAATALVGLLAASPLFSDPVFRSPVTKNAATGRERFNLELRIAPEAGE